MTFLRGRLFEGTEPPPRLSFQTRGARLVQVGVQLAQVAAGDGHGALHLEDRGDQRGHGGSALQVTRLRLVPPVALFFIP